MEALDIFFSWCWIPSLEINFSTEHSGSKKALFWGYLRICSLPDDSPQKLRRDSLRLGSGMAAWATVPQVPHPVICDLMWFGVCSAHVFAHVQACLCTHACMWKHALGVLPYVLPTSVLRPSLLGLGFTKHDICLASEPWDPPIPVSPASCLPGKYIINWDICKWSS